MSGSARLVWGWSVCDQGARHPRAGGRGRDQVVKAPPERRSLDGCRRKHKKGKARNSKCRAENSLKKALEGGESKVRESWPGHPGSHLCRWWGITSNNNNNSKGAFNCIVLYGLSSTILSFSIAQWKLHWLCIQAQRCTVKFHSVLAHASVSVPVPLYPWPCCT